MIFSWLRNYRRRKLLATPFPPEWADLLGRIAHVRLLSAAEQARLRDLVRVFIAEKEFEGCNGLEMNDEVRVTVAALASLLVLGFEDEHFENVLTILVYPTAFVVSEKKALADDVVLETESDRLGEAHYRGPVILSWDEVRLDAQSTGQGTNLVFHEFAHQLDMQSGEADGVPSLPRALRPRWQSVMAREYKKLCRAADRGRETLIDPYGTSEPAEFFAVVTECFFDLPGPLREQHPELYELFREFYKQDPAARVS